MASLISMMVLAFVALLAAAAYFAPTIVAYTRGAPDPISVLVINLFAGWTFIGWVIAMMMAARDRPQTGGVYVTNTLNPPPGWGGPQLPAPDPRDWPAIPPPGQD